MCDICTFLVPLPGDTRRVLRDHIFSTVLQVVALRGIHLYTNPTLDLIVERGVIKHAVPTPFLQKN